MSFDLKSVKKSKKKEREMGGPPPEGVVTFASCTGREWSPEQKAIFAYCGTQKGNLLVEALAGTGKTTTIVEAINHLPQPSRILLCAFNKRIADELKERVPYPTAEVATLHSLGYRLVRRLWPAAQVDDKRGYRLAIKASAKVGAKGDRQTQQCIKDLTSTSKEVAPFANSWNDLVDVGRAFGCFDGLYNDGTAIEKVAQAAWECRKLSVEEPDGTIDYADMLFIPLQKNLTRGEFDVVIVDEAQDMNKAQLELAQRVLKKTGRIIIVGDRHQAIYGFRGADSGSLERLQKKFDCLVLPLQTTYRCPKAVVAVAQQFVPAFQAADTAPAGKVSDLQTNLLLKAARPGDFIISRLNAPLMSVCLDLVRARVKAKVEGRDVGKGLTAIIWKMHARSIEDLFPLIDEWEYRGVTRAKDDEVRAAQVRDQASALRVLADGADSVDHLCQIIDDLFVDTGGKGDAVICSTVHKIKGLEAKRVFVLADTFRVDPQFGGIKKKGIAMKFTPTGERIISGPQVEQKPPSGEEYNLCYVAVTRAKEELVFVRDDIEVEIPADIKQYTQIPGRKIDPDTGF